MGLEAIPPDQKAVLQLVLQQGRSYDDIAGLLGIEGETVRRRAHDALATLGPAGALDPTDQARICDYLLSQQGVSEREATRDLLSASGSARDWANAAASALGDLAPGRLPEVPSGGAPPPPPPEPPRREREPEPRRRPEPEAEPRRSRDPEDDDDERAAFSYFPDESGRRSPPAAAAPKARSTSSRLGGAIILAGIGIVLAVVLILILSGGDDSGDDETPVAGTNTTQTTGPSGATGTTGAPAPLAQVELRAADGSQAEGLAQIFARDNQRAVIVAGQGVKPGAYALWLHNDGGTSKLLGFVPNRVGNDGRFVTQGGLPSDASKFKEMIITREEVAGNNPQLPKTPGTIILRGQLRGVSGSR